MAHDWILIETNFPKEDKMPTAKEEMIAILGNQPDDSTYDDLLRELAFKKMIDKGLMDSREGKTVQNEEMRRIIESWQK